MHGIDTTENVFPKLGEIEFWNRTAENKIEWIGRYLAPYRSWKVAEPEELEELHKAGFFTVGIFEKNPTHVGYFTRAQALEDLNDLLAIRRRYHIPDTGCVYLTVDYDAGEADWLAIREYLREIVGGALKNGLKNALRSGGFGIYGSGWICSMVLMLHPEFRSWRAMSEGWRKPPDGMGVNNHIIQLGACDSFSFDADWDYANNGGGWRVDAK